MPIVPNLKIVPPSEPSPAEKVRQRIKRAPKPEAMLQCNRCGGREVVETKTGVVLKNGKPGGGTRQYVCANCLSHGTRVVLA